MILRVHPDNPNPRLVEHAVRILQDDGVAIYPTDTIYGLGCAINSPKAVERIIQMKGLKPKGAQFSFICESISQITEFARVSNEDFRMLREYLPGPFTFILPGLKRLPEYFHGKRKTVGIRIPNHKVPIALVHELGVPILTTSLPLGEEVSEYGQDPELMEARWGHLVDVVIDSGIGALAPSTVVDCTGAEPEILREGKGCL